MASRQFKVANTGWLRRDLLVHTERSLLPSWLIQLQAPVRSSLVTKQDGHWPLLTDIQSGRLFWQHTFMLSIKSLFLVTNQDFSDAIYFCSLLLMCPSEHRKQVISFCCLATFIFLMPVFMSPGFFLSLLLFMPKQWLFFSFPLDFFLEVHVSLATLSPKSGTIL